MPRGTQASSRFPSKFAQTSIKETNIEINRVGHRAFVIAGGHIFGPVHSKPPAMKSVHVRLDLDGKVM